MVVTDQVLNGIVEFLHTYQNAEPFLRDMVWSAVLGCWVCEWKGILVGVESDGYVHS